MKETNLKESKILVIVESPAKSKTISGILKNAGYSHAVVMASVGHILELADGGPCYNSGIYPEEDFRMNLKVIPDKKKLVSDIKDQVKRADKVYLMTDGDREGEVISWSLIEFCKIPAEKCYRAITHEITPKAVVHAIENPISLNIDLVSAGKARMILDKLIGYGLSPAARKCIGAKSVGRCQSVGLSLVVDRENEILNFIPERYYELFLSYKKQDQEFQARYIDETGKDTKIVDKSIADSIIKDCAGNNYVIENISTVKRLEYPKPPFCTATFQQEAASRLGLSVKSAMSYAQKLYEGISIGGKHIGLLSYMRTDATDLSPEFLPELKEYIDTTYGTGTYRQPKVGKKTGAEQNGHEALRIIAPEITPEELKKYIQNEYMIKVYRLIWQRTVASAMPPAEISETTYLIKNGKHSFVRTSRELVSLGYRQVSPPEMDKEPMTTCTFAIGEVLQDTELSEVEKQTQPKPRYTEASLVKELQQREIGRPSTYATIVDTILSSSRGYATLEEKKIVPTDRGIQLAAFCSRAFPNIINYDYTRQMEESLDKIANGELSYLDYLKAFFVDLETAIKNNKEYGYFQQEEKVCPLCGSKMVIRRNRFGKLFYGCSNYPSCHGIENINS